MLTEKDKDGVLRIDKISQEELNRLIEENLDDLTMIMIAMVMHHRMCAKNLERRMNVLVDMIINYLQ